MIASRSDLADQKVTGLAHYSKFGNSARYYRGSAADWRYVIDPAWRSVLTSPRLVTSSSHEWSQRAQQYFSKGLFSEAALAFKNAGMDWWERVAMAYGKRQATMRLPPHHPLRQSSFSTVAQEFERLAGGPEGVDNPTTRDHLFLNAGECYAAVSNHGASASAFITGKRYTEAAYHYRMAGSFGKAVDVIKRHPVNSEIAESITYTAKTVYTKRGDASSLQ